MKSIVGFLSLFVCLLLLPVGITSANGSEIVQPMLQGAARGETDRSFLEVVGVNDEDGHGDTDEDDHSDDDGHADNGDDHSDDDGHAESDVDSHADESDAHMDDADDHAQTSDGHGSDDGHHDDQPFTLRTLLPLFAGIFSGLVASVLAKSLLSGIGSLDLGIIGLTALTGVLHLVLGLAGERLLLLNGVGYLALLVLVYLPATPLKALRIPLRIILGLYTLATIIGYFWLHSPAQYDVLAILSKVVEVALLVLVISSISKATARI